MKFEQPQFSGRQLELKFDGAAAEHALDELRNKPSVGVESQVTQELLDNDVELSFDELLAFAELMQEIKKENIYEGLTKEEAKEKAAERIRKTLVSEYQAVPHPYGEGWYSFRLNTYLAAAAEKLLRKECGDDAIRVGGHRVTRSKLLVVNVKEAAKFKLEQAA